MKEEYSAHGEPPSRSDENDPRLDWHQVSSLIVLSFASGRT